MALGLSLFSILKMFAVVILNSIKVLSSMYILATSETVRSKNNRSCFLAHERRWEGQTSAICQLILVTLVGPSGLPVACPHLLHFSLLALWSRYVMVNLFISPSPLLPAPLPSLSPKLIFSLLSIFAFQYLDARKILPVLTPRF